jgi:aminomethyltransferase
MAQHTTLYDWHVAQGARMVDFADWDMPIQYSTIIEEHTAVRTGAGLFDISHMGRLSFGGPDTVDLIQHIFTNNAATMKDFQVRYGLVCNEKGGIRDDVLVYKWPYGYAMVVNASNRLKILDWLGLHKGNRNVQIADQTLGTCMIAIQGPAAVEMCKGLTEADSSQLSYYYAMPTRYRNQQCVVSRTGYTGEDGLEFMIAAAHGLQLWEELLSRGARPCGLGARDTLRLEAAMPLYGHELNEEIDPLQAGLGWAVKMDKGDFVGRAALEKRRDDPTLRRRVGLELIGKRLAREGSSITTVGRDVGRVCSGTFAPTLQKAIAMAYVDRACTAPETALEVDIRGKSQSARVVPLPFYKRAKN